MGCDVACDGGGSSAMDGRRASICVGRYGSGTGGAVARLGYGFVDVGIFGSAGAVACNGFDMGCAAVDVDGVVHLSLVYFGTYRRGLRA